MSTKVFKGKKLKITYREPNSIEIFELWGVSGFGSENRNANTVISSILKEAHHYFESSSDGKSWDELIANKANIGDLRDFALDLVKVEVSEKEKK